jgi:hypothetical protein
MDTITLLGIFIILLYSIVKILNFYGKGSEVYGIYVVFYITLIILYFILPHDYPKI